MTPEKPDNATGPKQDQGPDQITPGARTSLLSHDLRSALADILGGLRLIDHDRLDGETRAHFDRIEVAGEAMARLLDTSLAPECSGPHQAQSQLVNLNLAEFIEDIRKRWSARAKEQGLSFRIEKSSALPAIVTLDRVTLERVVSNLLGNAIKFSDTGEVLLSVACQPDDSLILTIRDQGPGISRTALAHLFEFEGRPGDTDKPGTGLGLFIAKELSGQMGASLKLSNRRSGGCEAVLRLPHDRWFNRSLRRGLARDETVSSPQVDLSGLRILLAEDNKINQLVATQMLGSLGADYVVASDGLEALEMLEHETFDLALLDIEMPRMTGLELIRVVRAMPSPLADMPLVALTAYVMREHRERIYAAGADGIIAKPVTNIADLGRHLLEILQRATERVEAAPQSPPEGPMNAGSDVVDRQVFDTLIETIGADSTGELLEKLQVDADSVAEGLGRGRETLDLTEIRAQTHILVSVAGAIGAGSLQRTAQRLNAAANREDADEVDALCATCLAGLAALQGFIHDEQEKVLVPPASNPKVITSP